MRVASWNTCLDILFLTKLYNRRLIDHLLKHHLLFTELVDDLEARDLKEIEHILLQDLLVAIRVHNLQNLAHHAPMLGLLHVKV